MAIDTLDLDLDIRVVDYTNLPGARKLTVHNLTTPWEESATKVGTNCVDETPPFCEPEPDPGGENWPGGGSYPECIIIPEPGPGEPGGTTILNMN
jgi:hypothetical protein